MEIKPVVSVVMITYNHEEFLSEAINGVLMQNVNFDIEFIIADDNSPDNTKNIVDSFSGHQNARWIKYTRHTSNKGMMPNFIWALNNAKGKYLAFCEGDDYWTDPLKLKKQADFLENDNNKKFIACCHRAIIVDEKNNFIKMQPEFSSDEVFSFDQLIKGWFIPTASIMIRNILSLKSLSNYKNIISGDRLLISILADQGDFKFEGEIRSAYRKHSGGISSWGNKALIFDSNINLFKQLKSNLSLKRKKQLHKQINYWRIQLIRELVASKNYNNLIINTIKFLYSIRDFNDVKSLLLIFKK